MSSKGSLREMALALLKYWECGWWMSGTSWTRFCHLSKARILFDITLLKKHFSESPDNYAEWKKANSKRLHAVAPTFHITLLKSPKYRNEEQVARDLGLGGNRRQVIFGLLLVIDTFCLLTVPNPQLPDLWCCSTVLQDVIFGESWVKITQDL